MQPSSPDDAEHDGAEHDDGDPGDPDPDDGDLAEVETSMSRLLARTRGWLAVLLALALLVPFGSWLVDEYVFATAGSDVEQALGADAALVDAMLLVSSTDCAGRTSTGSAFVLAVADHHVVVTNRHVVDGAAAIGLRPLTGGEPVPVVGHHVAADADVAVLEVTEGLDLPDVALAAGRSAIVEDDVRVVGFPGGRPTLVSGRVDRESPRRLVLDLQIDPGASGSPVLDPDGRVVGQVHARTADGRGVATPLDALLAAIDAARAQRWCTRSTAQR